MKYGEFPKITSLKGVADFRAHLATLGIDMPCDDIVAGGSESPLAAPVTVDGMTIGNRFCIHPMEGWDGTREGAPTENTARRWRRRAWTSPACRSAHMVRRAPRGRAAG